MTEKSSTKINHAARKSTGRPPIKTPPTMQAAALPLEGYARIWHIIGNRKKGIQGVLPMSRSSFLAGVKSGKLKITPVKLGERTTGYRVEEIRASLNWAVRNGQHHHPLPRQKRSQSR